MRCSSQSGLTQIKLHRAKLLSCLHGELSLKNIHATIQKGPEIIYLSHWLPFIMICIWGPMYRKWEGVTSPLYYGGNSSSCISGCPAVLHSAALKKGAGELNCNSSSKEAAVAGYLKMWWLNNIFLFLIDWWYEQQKIKWSGFKKRELKKNWAVEV